jgi:carbon monoxide dehydrogenase subunit G
MEHEVFVPVPAERLREALADPVRVARAVPGLQQDAGAEPVTGRLKVRVGGHTITYRGSARLSAHEDGSHTVEGDATEARGTGAVKLTLTLRVTEAEGGSTLTFDGTASADGRVTELPAEAVASAVTRLLSRFAENLGASEPPAGKCTGRRGASPVAADDVFVPPVSEGAEPPVSEGRVSPTAEGMEPRTAEGTGAQAAEGAGPSVSEGAESPVAEGAEPQGSGDPGSPGPDDAEPPAAEAAEDFEPAASGDFEAGPDADDAPVPADRPADIPGALDEPDVPEPDGTPVPEDRPAAPEPADTSGAHDEPIGAPGPVDEPAAPQDFTGTPDLPAEAAHARRTMIGRSAEEVDHAPPRGRYAPVPAPQTVAPHSALRWAAPAAALALASAIVVGRALRKRR